VKDKSKIVRIVFAKLLQKPVALLVGFFLLKRRFPPTSLVETDSLSLTAPAAFEAAVAAAVTGLIPDGDLTGVLLPLLPRSTLASRLIGGGVSAGGGATLLEDEDLRPPRDILRAKRWKF